VLIVIAIVTWLVLFAAVGTLVVVRGEVGSGDDGDHDQHGDGQEHRRGDGDDQP